MAYEIFHVDHQAPTSIQKTKKRKKSTRKEENAQDNFDKALLLHRRSRFPL
jgi:hypothetical protein